MIPDSVSPTDDDALAAGYEALAAERNAAHNAERMRTMSAELAESADKLWQALPYLRDWYDSVTALKNARPDEVIGSELRRLARVSSILCALVNEANAKTAEAKRINERIVEEEAEAHFTETNVRTAAVSQEE